MPQNQLRRPVTDRLVRHEDHGHAQSQDSPEQNILCSPGKARGILQYAISHADLFRHENHGSFITGDVLEV
jgi:hypothetical protein